MSSCPSNRPVFGVCPIAMNTPSTPSSRSAPDPVFRIRRPVTPESSPRTSSTTWFHRIATLASRVLASRRSARIRSARNRSPAMDDVHRRSDVREVERLFDRGIAAADHRHRPILEEEPVTGGAGRDAGPLVPLLRGKTEILRRRPGGDDERIAGVDVLVADEAEGRFGEVRGVDVVEDRLGAEPLRCARACGPSGPVPATPPRRPASCRRPWWSSSVPPSPGR